MCVWGGSGVAEVSLSSIMPSCQVSTSLVGEGVGDRGPRSGGGAEPWLSSCPPSPGRAYRRDSSSRRGGWKAHLTLPCSSQGGSGKWPPNSWALCPYLGSGVLLREALLGHLGTVAQSLEPQNPDP